MDILDHLFEQFLVLGQVIDFLLDIKYNKLISCHALSFAKLARRVRAAAGEGGAAQMAKFGEKM